MDYKVEHLYQGKNLLEGPHWMEDQQKLLMVDILGKRVQIYDPQTKDVQTVEFDDMVGFAVPHESGGYVAGVGRKLLHFQFNDTKNAKVLAEIEKGTNNRFNDGKCDPQGRIFAGTCSLAQTQKEPLYAGNLYRFDHNAKVTKIQDRYNVANGLAWSMDGRKFYHADSIFPSAVYQFDFDPETGNATNRRILSDFSDVVNPIPNFISAPDGMTIDTDGFLWLALHGAGKVVRIDPNNGKVVREVKIPIPTVTSCAFGGKNLDELYVTTMKGDNNDIPPEAGSLYRITGLGVKGIPAVSFKGTI